MKAGDPLRSVLAIRRHEINRQFAAVRAEHRGLENEDVFAFLNATVSPIADSLHQIRPDAVLAAVDALCAVGFPLVAQGWLGPKARQPELASHFARILTRLPRLLAEDPRRFAGSIVNVLYHLSETPGMRIDEWAASLCELAADADLDTALTIGQIAAWRYGMAHVRDGALDLLGRLPPALAARIIGAPHPLDAADVARLRADPWLSPARLDERAAAPRLRAVGRIGDFVGFGGAFRAPPQVCAAGGHLYAIDGERSYRLHADVFGTVLRAVPGALPAPSPSSARIDPAGQVRFLDGLAELPPPLRGASAADDGTTLAVASNTSHHVWLFARVSA